MLVSQIYPKITRYESVVFLFAVLVSCVCILLLSRRSRERLQRVCNVSFQDAKSWCLAITVNNTKFTKKDITLQTNRCTLFKVLAHRLTDMGGDPALILAGCLVCLLPAVVGQVIQFREDSIGQRR